jgi:predicted short-subunit dehydrogenase-like oxidoreductase (DUF2520 family)
MMSEPSTGKLVFIGAGNVATWLATTLFKEGWNIDVIYNRTPPAAKILAEKVNARWTSNFNEIDPDPDIIIFALTDQAVVDIVDTIGFRNSLLIHTAGSLPLDTFAGRAENYGVLYPLQTISGRKMPENTDIPVCIESNTGAGMLLLRSLAGSISKSVYEISSEKRMILHLAAVFACNFTNHMYCLAEEIARTAGLSFNMYHALIRETAEKAIGSGPLYSQTGPAVRNDMIIIKKHLDLLSFSPEIQDIYGRLTESIINKRLSSTGKDD